MSELFQVETEEKRRKKELLALLQEFDTLDKAIIEIYLLRQKNARLKLELGAREIELSESKKPRKRGRPSKKEFSAFSTFEDVLKKALGIKNKGGRPIKHHKAARFLKIWDETKEHLAKVTGKKSVTDLFMINHILNNDKGTSLKHKLAQRKVWRSRIKQYRDKTGIRMHKRKLKKAENLPSK